jgi:CBS domain-containing protein
MQRRRPITPASSINPMAVEEILPGTAAAAALTVAIDAASGPVALALCARQARLLALDMSESGIGSEAVTRALSLHNDRIVQRLIGWASYRFRMPATAWCWLGLGSEGRLEQTLHTDQDNGLIFAASDQREAHSLREHFLPFARTVNEALAECGFPLCDGDVMASNPKWCLSLAEWRDCFSRWVRTPEPDALLNASIFFDLRPIAGDISLAVSLREHLTVLARGNDIFLRMMAENALKATPPLGRIKDFLTDTAAGDTVDLKKSGARLFVDAARILSLAEGVAAVGTVERLRGVAARNGLSSAEAMASQHAFIALQNIRLDAQRTRAEGDNLVVPDQLNDFDRRVLLAALRQARALQNHLKIRYQIEN